MKICFHLGDQFTQSFRLSQNLGEIQIPYHGVTGFYPPLKQVSTNFLDTFSWPNPQFVYCPQICGLSTIFCGLLSTKFVDCPQFFLKSDGDPQFTNCPQFSSKCILWIVHKLWIVHNFRITRPLEDRIFFSRLRRAKLEYFPLTTALKALKFSRLRRARQCIFTLTNR